MVAEAVYFGDECVIEKVASGAVASGEILRLDDGRAAVNGGLKAAATNDTIGQRTCGLFDIQSASGTTFSIGDPVFWDASASLAVPAAATLDGSEDHYLGTAVRAKTSGQTTVRVDLNAGFQRLRPFVYEFDCETGVDSAVHTLIPAYMNPTGLMLLSITGYVTEVFGGASEDQGVITIKNTAGSPATLSTLTPSDAGADAIGDVIQAAGAANAIYSVTGVAVKQVAAGLGVTGAVTTPTSGASAAGKVKVFILAVPLA